MALVRQLGPKVLGHVIYAIFGPGHGYDRRAAVAFRCHPANVRSVVYGCQAMPRRWWSILLAVQQARRDHLARERKLHKAAIDREYDAHLRLWASAQAEIELHIKSIREMRVRKGLE